MVRKCSDILETGRQETYRLRRVGVMEESCEFALGMGVELHYAARVVATIELFTKKLGEKSGKMYSSSEFQNEFFTIKLHYALHNIALALGRVFNYVHSLTLIYSAVVNETNQGCR